MTTIYLDRATHEVSANPFGPWQISARIELPSHQHIPDDGQPIEWVDADTWLQATKSDLAHIRENIIAAGYRDEIGHVWDADDRTFAALSEAVETGNDILWRDADGRYKNLTHVSARNLRNNIRNFRVSVSQALLRKEREAEDAARSGFEAFDPLAGWP